MTERRPDPKPAEARRLRLLWSNWVLFALTMTAYPMLLWLGPQDARPVSWPLIGVAGTMAVAFAVIALLLGSVIRVRGYFWVCMVRWSLVHAVALLGFVAGARVLRWEPWAPFGAGAVALHALFIPSVAAYRRIEGDDDRPRSG